MIFDSRVRFFSKGYIYLVAFLTLFCEVLALESSQDAFTRIYQTGVWGRNENGEGTSGEGSVIANASEYIACLNQFILNNNVSSILDVGCGDWEITKDLRLEHVEYVGIDVVPKVIENNSRMYGRDNIHFQLADFTEEELPSMDLLICKDVLQHLPNKDIFCLIRQLAKFKWILITNDVLSPGIKANRKLKERGGYRPIDLRCPPFMLNATSLKLYKSGGRIKQVLFINNQS